MKSRLRIGPVKNGRIKIKSKITIKIYKTDERF
jgi:hypothetical protein